MMCLWDDSASSCYRRHDEFKGACSESAAWTNQKLTQINLSTKPEASSAYVAAIPNLSGFLWSVILSLFLWTFLEINAPDQQFWYPTCLYLSDDHLNFSKNA